MDAEEEETRRQSMELFNVARRELVQLMLRSFPEGDAEVWRIQALLMYVAGSIVRAIESQGQSRETIMRLIEETANMMATHKLSPGFETVFAEKGRLARGGSA